MASKNTAKNTRPATRMAIGSQSHQLLVIFVQELSFLIITAKVGIHLELKNCDADPFNFLVWTFHTLKYTILYSTS